MRIRKNAKLSPLWFSHASAPETLQAHVCQLNQSPWDVLPLTHQFEGDDSLTGNASLGDSIGAVESVASMMDAVAAKAEDMVLAVNDNGVVEKKGRALDQRARENEFGGHGFEKAVDKKSSSCCQKTDGKGWQCRNEAKEGQSLCEHHLNLLRSYNTGNSNSSSISFRKSSAAAAAAAAAAAGARRARARAAKKGSSSAASNPYEFYYYSGFGPLWGRKRGDRSGGGGGGGGEDGTKSTHHQEAAAKVVVVAENVNNNSNNNNNNNSVSAAATQSSTTPSSSSQFDNEEFDYVDDDDEDDGGDSGKKRMRKPVKARSLKSLM